ncbi:MAG: O-methyltransferase [Sphingobacteriaceae bacterium]
MINSWQIKHYIKHWFTAKRKGHGVHSPFVYALVENVFSNTFQFYSFNNLTKTRKQLQLNDAELEVTDLGAGSKKFSSNKRKISDIAKHGISSKKQSEVYFKLINYLKCETIIELGTSIGLNTLYMHAAAPNSKIYTLEGSSQIAHFAKRLFEEKKAEGIQLIEGAFKNTLPVLLEQIKQFDLLYIDGDHTYLSTKHYFELALNKKHANSVIIFDDIYWSEEMTKCWEEIKQHPDVKLSIDCFYFGMVFFKDEFKQKEHFKLYV